MEESIKSICELKSKYEYPNIQKVYTSPLKRCKETAEVIYPENFIVEMDSLTELDFGDFEGQTISSLEMKPEFINWIGDIKNNTPPNGETQDDFSQRVLESFQEIVKDMMKNKITSTAVVTHGSVIMNLLSNCGLPKQSPLYWMVGSGKGVTILINSIMWGNDNLFEIAGIIPYGLDTFK